MTMIRRILLLSVLLSLYPALAHAQLATVYVTQSGAGSQSGADCGNAKPFTFFNTGGNWGTGGAQIGPGTTVFFCNGTITSAISFLGNGTSGHPIVLDGTGATMNNTIAVISTSWFTVQNFTCQLNYTVTPHFITLDNASNGTVQGNFCDSMTASTTDADVVFLANGSGMSNLVDIKNNTFGSAAVSNSIQMDVISTEGATNITIEGNILTDRASGSSHNDDLQIFCKNAGSNCPNGFPANWTVRYNLIVMNNTAANNKNQCPIEDLVGTNYFYDNVFLGIMGATQSNGCYMTATGGSGAVFFVYNNTAVAKNGPNNMWGLNGTGTYTMVGNVASANSGMNMLQENSGNTRNHNLWFGGNLPSCTGHTGEICGSDPLFTNFSTNDFSLQASSPGRNAAPNQSAIFTTGIAPGATWPNPALVTRPPTGNWDMGAYQGSGSITANPNSVACGAVLQGNTATCGTVTETNSSGSSITMSAPTFSGTNAGDFSSTGCTSGTLTNGNTCIITVKFTPTGTPILNETATMKLNYTGFTGSPPLVTLTGTSGNSTPPNAPTGLGNTVH